MEPAQRKCVETLFFLCSLHGILRRFFVLPTLTPSKTNPSNFNRNLDRKIPVLDLDSWAIFFRFCFFCVKEACKKLKQVVLRHGT